jgi:hypothetical protein
MKLSASLLCLAFLVGGCQSVPEDPEVWVRIDGQKGAGNPVLMQQYEVDSTICLGQTQQSAVGMAPIYYQGVAGAIGASVIQSQRNAALTDVVKGCMAQKGYMRVRSSQAEAMRARFAENAAAQAKASKKKL